MDTEDKEEISSDEERAQFQKNLLDICADIRSSYQVGDFLVVSTQSDKHVGFFVGVREVPYPSLLLAGVTRASGLPRIGKEFDVIHRVLVSTIRSVRASPVKEEPDERLEVKR